MNYTIKQYYTRWWDVFLTPNTFLVFFFQLFFLFQSISIFSQTTPCGTANVIEKNRKNIDSDFDEETKKQFRVSFLETLSSGKVNTPIYYPVRFIVVSPTDSSYISQIEIDNSLKEANASFKDAGVQFYECAPKTVIIDPDADLVFSLYTFFNSPLYLQHHEEGMVEIWITHQLEGVYLGVTYLSKNEYPILLSKGGIANSYTLSHELGHYFNLNHTHENYFPEFVNGSNCYDAGDYICDTSADPNLLGYYKVNPNCTYIAGELDPNGDVYKPLTDNIMSYGPDGCSPRFTPMQLAEIAWVAHLFGSSKTGCTDWQYKPSIEGNRVSPTVPFTVQFHANSPDSDTFEWDFNEDGIIDSYESDPIYTYTENGSFDVKLRLSKNGKSFDWIERDWVAVGGLPLPYFEDFSRFNLKSKQFGLIGGWAVDSNINNYTSSGWLPLKLDYYAQFDHSFGFDNKVLYSNFISNQTLDTNIIQTPFLNIPIDLQTPILSFWHHLYFPGNGILHFDLIINDVLLTDFISPLIGPQQDSLKDDFKQIKIDLTDFKGKSIALRLRATEEVNSNINSRIIFLIDDILVYDQATISIANLPKQNIQIAEGEANETVNCQKTKTLEIPIILRWPTQGDTSYIHIKTSGTASYGIDFTMPYQTLVLPPGTTDTVRFYVTIFDDQEDENDENIIFTLSKEGKGDLWLPDSIITLSILDNDKSFDFSNKIYGEKLVAFQDFEGAFNGWERVNIVNPAGVTWLIGNYPNWVSNNNFDGQISASWGAVGDETNKFAYPFLPTTYAHGNKDLILASPFFENSTIQSISVDFETFCTPYGDGKYSIEYQTTNSNTWHNWAKIKSSNVWTHKHLDFETDTILQDSIRLGFRYIGSHFKDDWWLDDIKITAQGVPTLDTTLHHQAKNHLGPFQTVHLFSEEDSSIIATVENLSNHSFGCVSARIEHTGLDIIPFSSGTLADKTLFLDAQFPNEDAAVRIIFYYHLDEISAWEAATGQSKNTLQILHSSDKILENGPISGFSWLDDVVLSPYSTEGHQRLEVQKTGITGGYGIGTTIPVSTTEQKSLYQHWQAYPNPTSGRVQLSQASTASENPSINQRFEPHFCKVYTAQGALIRSFSFFGKKTDLDLSQEVAGLYFVEIASAEGVVLLRVLR